MNDDEKLVHDIVASIYDTALEPKNWSQVLDRVAGYVGAVGALIIDLTVDNAQRQLVATHFTSNYDMTTAETYLNTFAAEELEDQRIFAQHSNRSNSIELVSDSVLAHSREVLEQRKNVQFMRSIGLAYRAGALLNKDIIVNDRLGLQFDKSQGPLNEAHIVKAGYFLPHIAKALNIGRPTNQLASRYSAVLEGLNQLKSGVCIVDENRNVVVRNAEFDRQLELYDVFRVTLDGRLAFNQAATMKSAVEMFSSVAFHGRFGARPRKEALNSDDVEQEHQLCIEILPLDDTSGVDNRIDGASILFSLDTSLYADIDVDRIATAYDLTRSETDVFELLIQGLTNPQIAERCDKAVETVNTQVKSILSKTMASNRTQLIRMASHTGSALLT